MANMEFTMLPTELRNNPRWRRLERHPTARLTYLSLMTCSSITFTGYFLLPLPIFAHDSMIPVPDIECAFEVLVEAGMAEFDSQTQFVRIINWFNGRRTPCNRKFLKSTLKSYRQAHIPGDSMTARSAAELAVAGLIRSQDFSSATQASTQHKAEYTSMIVQFVVDSRAALPEWQATFQAEVDKAGSEFPTFLKSADELFPPASVGRTSIPTRTDCSQTVPIPSADRLDTVSIPYQDRTKTVGEQEERESINRKDAYETGGVHPRIETARSAIAISAKKG